MFVTVDFVLVGVEAEVQVRRLRCCGDDGVETFLATPMLVPPRRRCLRIRKEGVAGTFGEAGIEATTAAVALT